MAPTGWSTSQSPASWKWRTSRSSPGNPDTNDSLKYRAFDLGLRYLFYDGHKVRPYVGAWLSYAQVNAVNIDIDSGLGLYGLAGLASARPQGINFMAELIYRWTEVQARYDLIDEKDVDGRWARAPGRECRSFSEFVPAWSGALTRLIHSRATGCAGFCARYLNVADR